MRSITRRGMVVALVATGLLADRSALAWNPLKSAAKSAATGAVEAIEPTLAATIENTFASGHELVSDVDARLTGQVQRVQTLAGTVVADVDGRLAQRVSQIDDTLEKRILQIQRSATDVIADLDGRVKEDLRLVDGILSSRITQVQGALTGALSQADGILEQRLAQLDESVGRRLGNVDVIATKQRLAVEQTLLRVAVLLGLVVFVVIVLVRLWRLYGRLAEELSEEPAAARRWHLTTGLAVSLSLQVAAAGVAAGLLAVLYHRLPLGAARKADELMAQHRKELAESLAMFEFTRARFHASQLELLMPADSRVWRAAAAKGELMRDVLARPTLLSSASGISSVMERVAAVERLLGERADPDLLVLKAVILWRVGQERRDEHEAASLCTRAFRIAPNGFALAPLGRSIIRSFLDAPYFDAETPLGRDAESTEEMETLLTSIHVSAGGFPLAANVALEELTRTLSRASSQAYVLMLEAHARAVRLASAGARAELSEARRERTRQAKAVVAAWDDFDRAIEEVPGLAGSPAVLGIFRLNDVYYSRAKWFTRHEEATDVAPLLSETGKGALSAAARAELAPPRITWSRRYGPLVGRTRDLLEFQEAQRWKALERATRAFDQAVVALHAARPGADVERLRRRAALEAARLGIYIDAAGTRRPYALALFGGPLEAVRARADAKARAELDEIATALGMRTASVRLPEVAGPSPAPRKRTTAALGPRGGPA